MGNDRKASKMKTYQYLKNLEAPQGTVDVILDTDAFNEIDDQFALAYLLLNRKRLHTVGICAAPFLNEKSVSPEDGMNKSYDEILKVLGLMGRGDLTEKVYRSAAFMTDEKTPVPSAAASFLAQTAEKYSPENPLYIIAIGAITNVASAILLNRDAMCENTVVIWLGGNAHGYPYGCREFNMIQDIDAARVVLASAVPTVQLPCVGVVSEFRTTKPELDYWLGGQNPLCRYLAENVYREMEVRSPKNPVWSKCIWDVTAVAWLLNDRNRYMMSYRTPAPIPQHDGFYAFDVRGKQIEYVYRINRDSLLRDLFDCLRAFSREDTDQ